MTVLVLAEEGGGFNPFDPQFGLWVWTIIAFIIVFVVLARRVFPRLQEGLADRERRIKEDLERAEQTKTEAEAALEEYRQKINQAREESNRIVEEARRSADAVRRDLVEKAETEAREILNRAQQQLNAERERAVGELQHQLAGWSAEIASRIIQRELDAGTQAELVDSFINDLQNQTQRS
jgi:F-type H+-transporting ATPase subunit b